MMLESKNMQYAFQVEYPNIAVKMDKKDASSLNKELVDLFKQDVLDEAFSFSMTRVEKLEAKNTYTFKMKVLYPGLLIGTGYPHMTGKPTGEIQIGCSFDYVTGLPYYPGSSLKGTLRHPFNMATSNCDSSEEYLDYLREIFNKSEIAADEIRKFIDQTFNGCEEGEAEGLPMQSRDVFYDSYPIGFASDGAPSRLMKLDNLAPHIDKETRKPNTLKNPIPLTMIRVMPNTCFAFQMKLHDVIGDNGEVLFSAKEKLEAFKAILTDFGIGAKTNVGYGNLEEFNGVISAQLQRGNVIDSAVDSVETKDNLIPDNAGEAPICKSCNHNKVAYNFNTKSWGNYCTACLEEKRKNRNNAEKKVKNKAKKPIEEPMDEMLQKLKSLKMSMDK